MAAKNFIQEAPGVKEADPQPPTYLPSERSAGRPSTPEGVGREAPLTACRRGAKSSARSAREESGGRGSPTVPGVDQVVEKVVDPASTPALACRSGRRRPRPADHAYSRSKNRIIHESTWSAGRGLEVGGDQDGCGCGVAGGRQRFCGGRGRCGGGVGYGDVAGDGRGTKAGEGPSNWYVDGTGDSRGWYR